VFFSSGKSPILFIGFHVICDIGMYNIAKISATETMTKSKTRRRPSCLVDLVLCLPSVLSDAERGFLELKMTKTDWPCSLRSSLLNDLLTLHLNPLPVTRLWNLKAAKQRIYKTFLHEVSQCDEEEYEIVAKKNSYSLIKTKGHFILFHFFIILSFPFMWRTE
jgi:hypothetical protein